MNRSKDVLGMAVACVLALGAALTGCAKHDQTFVANSPAEIAGPGATVDGAGSARDSANAPHDETSNASGDLPVVVITGHRQGWRSLVLSERNSGSQSD